MAVPSLWTPPVWPDFYTCNAFYASQNRPIYQDCQIALLMLLQGTQNITWQMARGIHGIPQVRTHGTCQIQLQASGPAAYLGQTFTFPPDMIRNMAGWVIDQCVDGSHTGGYVTAEFSNTAEYVALPEVFYEDPFPHDTTFLNVVVWNSDRTLPVFNPGNMDPLTGTFVLAKIAEAYAAEEDYSPLKQNIARNFEYFQKAVIAMRRGSLRTWWQGSRESVTNSSAANLTEVLNNFTQPANVTLPANFTLPSSKSTSICAGAGQGIAAGCGGQDDDFVATS